MDSRKPPQDPDHLLDDLESIHDLLGESDGEPPLLTESFEPDNIPLLSDVVQASPRPAPAEEEPEDDLPPAGHNREQARLDSELRAAAQLILQDVIDDFVPQIEAELQRRLEARLQRLLAQRKP